MDEELDRDKTKINNNFTALRTNPTQTVATAASAVWQPTAKVLEKGIDKATKIDYVKEMTDAFTQVQDIFGKVSEQVESGKFQNKLDEMINKYSGPKRNDNIGEDPSANPLGFVTQNMDNFNNQLRTMMTNTSKTNVFNNSGGFVPMGNIPVRDSELNRWAFESNYPHLR